MVQGGGIATKGQAIVTADGKHILLPNDVTINVYDAESGRRSGLLRGHSDIVTGIGLHPHNMYQVFSVSRDGTIRLWDFSDGVCARQLDTHRPIVSMVVPHRQDCLYFQHEADHKDFASITVQLDLTTWELRQATLKTKQASALEASNSGDLVGIAYSNTILVWPAEQGWKPALKLHHTKHITCMAIENIEGRIACGDVTGRILIWHDLKGGLEKARSGKDHNMPCTTVHWHANPVQCMSFSMDSSYLLSGGLEAVLVAWQMGTNSKRLLPRLSAGISGICPFRNDQGLYLLTQKDNTLRRINLASMKAELSISGIKPGPRQLPGQPDLHTPVALLPGGKQLAIAVENSAIQFYDAAKDKHLDKLQVKAVNVISPLQDRQKALKDWSDIEPQVTHIAFNLDGSIMATTDVQADASTSASYLTSLKFWKRRASGAEASTSGPYEIQTQIDDPHRLRVSGLGFHPSENLAVSISPDANCHLWQLMQRGKFKQWQCIETLSYQGLPILSLAFSADGSILALGCGHAVVLWSPSSAAVIDVLESSLGKPRHIDHLMFVPGTPFLASSMHGSKNYLIVWNLLLKAVWWAQQVSVTCLTVDSLGTGCIAVGVRPPGTQKRLNAPGFVAQFHAASPKPIQVWLIPRTLAVAVFFPPPSSQLFTMGQKLAPSETNPLLIFTKDRKFTIGSRLGVAPLPAEIEDTVMKDGSTPEMETLSAIAKKPAIVTMSPTEIISQHNLDAKAKVAMLFDAPSHVLPSLDILAPAFLETLTCGFEDR